MNWWWILTWWFCWSEQRWRLEGEFKRKIEGCITLDINCNTCNCLFLTGLSTDKYARRKQLKDRQLYARHMRNYSESLEGKAHGFKQITIIVDKSSAAKTNHGKGGHQGQKNKQVCLERLGSALVGESCLKFRDLLKYSDYIIYTTFCSRLLK